MPTPMTAPRMPMPTVSAMIWRTTAPQDQASRSKSRSPGSLVTLESVRTSTIKNAANNTTIASAPPRSLANLCASDKLPETESAGILSVSTVAPRRSPP